MNQLGTLSPELKMVQAGNDRGWGPHQWLVLDWADDPELRHEALTGGVKRWGKAPFSIFSQSFANPCCPSADLIPTGFRLFAERLGCCPGRLAHMCGDFAPSKQTRPCPLSLMARLILKSDAVAQTSPTAVEAGSRTTGPHRRGEPNLSAHTLDIPTHRPHF